MEWNAAEVKKMLAEAGMTQEEFARHMASGGGAILTLLCDLHSDLIRRIENEEGLSEEKVEELRSLLAAASPSGGEGSFLDVDNPFSISIIPPRTRLLCGRPLCSTEFNPINGLPCSFCRTHSYCSEACRVADAGEWSRWCVLPPQDAGVDELDAFFGQEDNGFDRFLQRAYPRDGYGGGHIGMCGINNLGSISLDRALSTFRVRHRYNSPQEALAEEAEGDILLFQLPLLGVADELGYTMSESSLSHPVLFKNTANAGIHNLLSLLAKPEPRNGSLPVAAALFPGAESASFLKDVPGPMLAKLELVTLAVLFYIDSRTIPDPTCLRARKRAEHIAHIIPQWLNAENGLDSHLSDLARSLLAMGLAQSLVFDISGLSPAEGHDLGLDSEWVETTLENVWITNRAKRSPALRMLGHHAAILLGLFVGVTDALFGQPKEKPQDKVRAHRVFERVFLTASPLSMYFAQAMVGMALTPLYAHDVGHAWSQGEVAIRSVRLASAALSILDSDRDRYWIHLADIAMATALVHLPPSMRNSPSWLRSIEMFASRADHVLSDEFIDDDYLAALKARWVSSFVSLSLFRHPFTDKCARRVACILATEQATEDDPSDTTTASSLEWSLHFGDGVSPRSLIPRLLEAAVPFMFDGRDPEVWEPELFRMEQVAFVFGLYRMVYGSDVPDAPTPPPEELLFLRDLAISVLRERENSDRPRMARLAALIEIHAGWIPFGGESYEVICARTASARWNGVTVIPTGLWSEVALRVSRIEVRSRSGEEEEGGGVKVLSSSVEAGLATLLSQDHPDGLWLIHQVLRSIRTAGVGEGDVGLITLFQRLVKASLLESFFHVHKYPWWASTAALSSFLGDVDSGLSSWTTLWAKHVFDATYADVPVDAQLEPGVPYVSFTRRVPGTWSVAVFGVGTKGSIPLQPHVLMLKVDSSTCAFPDQDMDAVWDAVDMLVMRLGFGARVPRDVIILCPHTLIDAHVHAAGTIPPVDREETIASVTYATLPSVCLPEKRSEVKGVERLARADVQVVDTFGAGPEVCFGSKKRKGGGRPLAASAVSLAEGTASERLMYWGVEGAGTRVPELDMFSLVIGKWVVCPTWCVAKDMAVAGVLSSSNDAFLADLVLAVDASSGGWESGRSIGRAVMTCVRRWRSEGGVGVGVGVDPAVDVVLNAALETTVCTVCTRTPKVKRKQITVTKRITKS